MNFRQFHRTYHMGRLAYRGVTSTAGARLSHPEYLLVVQRGLFYKSLRYAATDRSKVEYTLKMLRDDLKKQQDEEDKKLKLIPSKDVVVVKPPLKDRIMHELKHYYHGFRLLFLETKLSAKYCFRLLRGAQLTRRERQQLVRTVSDLFRLVPFSIFVIVPFMELALPIFIKLFPNMLPSTFQESSKEEEKIRKQVQVKVEMAKFLQDTIEEIALERKTKSISPSDSKALEFAQFIKKVRTEGGGYVSNEELVKFSKLFEDELTLDNLSMSQLRSLCRLMLIQPLGSPEILRFQLKLKLRELKADDKQIAAEGGVDALSTLDLQAACRARGMRALGVSEERLRENLKQWLELSLNDKVPPSLLLLSRTLYLPEDISFSDRLKSIMQNLPEGISEHVRQKITEIEGGKVDYAARVNLIKNIEDAISKEKQIAAQKKAEAEKRQKELQKKAEEEAAAAAMAEKLEQTIDEKLVGSPELTKIAQQAHASMEAVKEDLALAIKEVTKKEEVKVDPKDLSSIEQILIGGPIHEAKADIVGLREKVTEHSEDLMEVSALDGAFAETKVAQRLRSRLNTMIENVDTLVTKLEEEKKIVQETIADPAEVGSATVKKEKQVRIQDMIDSLTNLKGTAAGDGPESEKKRARLVELLRSIDEDEDGVIDANKVLQVISLLERHKDNMTITPAQIKSMIETLKKEDQVDALARAIESVKIEQPISPQASNVTVDVPNVDPKITEPLRNGNGNNGREKTAERQSS